MKFKELVMKHTWDQIEDRMIELYYGPDRIKLHYNDGDKLIRTEKEMKKYATKMMEGYKYVFLSLCVKKARADKDKKPWKIFVTYCDKDYNGNPEEVPYWTVDAENGELNSSDENYKSWYEEKEKNGKLTDADRKHFTSNIRFAIEFTPRSQWLAMDVDDESLAQCGEIDFICHCLWEMTFFGFSERSVTNQRSKLDKRVKDLDKQIEEGSLKTYSFEEFMARMNEKIEEKSEKRKNGKRGKKKGK